MYQIKPEFCVKKKKKYTLIHFCEFASLWLTANEAPKTRILDKWNITQDQIKKESFLNSKYLQ